MINSGCNNFTVINEYGNEVKCDILFTFDSAETGKSYIVYTDNSKDNNGNIQVFAATYVDTDDGTQLIAIETEREFQVIEIILNEIQNSIKNTNNDC